MNTLPMRALLDLIGTGREKKALSASRKAGISL